MKLEELYSIKTVTGQGSDAGRPTPVAMLGNYGYKHAPLFSELCKDRDWCEQKEVRKKLKKKLIKRSKI